MDTNPDHKPQMTNQTGEAGWAAVLVGINFLLSIKACIFKGFKYLKMYLKFL